MKNLNLNIGRNGHGGLSCSTWLKNMSELKDLIKELNDRIDFLENERARVGHELLKVVGELKDE